MPERGGIVRYDRIGRRYGRGRRTDPRWATDIGVALDGAGSVVNVGAGTGSYEPTDRAVVAVEPSTVMLAQRGPGAAPAVRAVAEALPFADATFDAAMAVLTVHHWTDLDLGLCELSRVAPRQVVLTFDAAVVADFWLVRDYLPHLRGGTTQAAPSLSAITEVLGPMHVRHLPLPRDFADGVMAAHWARPEAYLDEDVRANISCLALSDPTLVADAMARLRSDLQDGTWHRRNGALLDLDEYEAGYRLLWTDRDADRSKGHVGRAGRPFPLGPADTTLLGTARSL